MAAQNKQRNMRAAATLWLFCLVTSGALVVGGSKAESSDNRYTDWDHILAQTTPGKHRVFDDRFYAGLTGSLGGLLHILCVYHLEGRSAPVSLRGSRDGNGDFWPAVSLSVSNDLRATWASIGLFNPTAEPDFLIVNRQNPKATVWIAAERFRPFIGAQRWGRISLISDNQAGAIFALEDLLPPRGHRSDAGDFKEVLGDREKPQLGSAAVLRYVVFIRGQLTGEFTWVRDRPQASVKGAQTPAGDFWPTGKLEVEDSDGHWITVGEAKPNGSPRSIRQTQHIFGEPFRVDLEAYKKSIGHAKLGKVTFSDSSFALFALENIDPNIPEESVKE
jgi:hypothetical protein